MASRSTPSTPTSSAGPRRRLRWRSTRKAALGARTPFVLPHPKPAAGGAPGQRQRGQTAIAPNRVRDFPESVPKFCTRIPSLLSKVSRLRLVLCPNAIAPIRKSHPQFEGGTSNASEQNPASSVGCERSAQRSGVDGCNQTGGRASSAAAAYEVKLPVTSRSEQAKQEFLEGRDLSERLLGQESLQHFDKALSLDPEFASAELARANNSPTAKEFFDHLKKL